MDKNPPGMVNYVMPDVAMSKNKFEEMIRKAENGTFHTIAAVKQEMAKWKAKYQK